MNTWALVQTNHHSVKKLLVQPSEHAYTSAETKMEAVSNFRNKRHSDGTLVFPKFQENWNISRWDVIKVKPRQPRQQPQATQTTLKFESLVKEYLS